MKATLKIIFFTMMLFGIIIPAMAMDENNSFSSPFSPALVYSPNDKFEQVLKDSGFTQISVVEHKNGYIHDGMYEDLEDDIFSPSFETTFKKGEVTMKYKFAIDKFDDNIDFDYIEIIFPSKTERDAFLRDLTSYVEKKGRHVFHYDNCYFIGEDDEDIKNGIAFPYDQIEIKGNTIRYIFTHGMNPHSGFIN